jgi:hypothetical protein
MKFDAFFDAISRIKQPSDIYMKRIDTLGPCYWCEETTPWINIPMESGVFY